jgi:hypothetical protein
MLFGTINVSKDSLKKTKNHTEDELLSLTVFIEQVRIFQDKLKFILTNNITVKIAINIKLFVYLPLEYFHHHCLYRVVLIVRGRPVYSNATCECCSELQTKVLRNTKATYVIYCNIHS